MLPYGKEIMAQVVKQVISSQNFLSGLLALPQYAELRAKQVERLLVIFRGSKLSLDQAGPVLKVLDERIWDCESLGRLKSALADQTVEEINDPEKRAKAQDYSALPFYVPEDLWLCLEKADCAEEREKALQLVCDLAAQLGLRNPTEETCAVLYVLAFTMHPMAVVYDCEKVSLLQKWKPVMKRHLKKYSSSAEGLQVLPLKVAECPSILMRAAFPNGWKSAQPRVKTLEEVQRLARTRPLRMTHTFANVSKTSQMPQQAMNVDLLGVAAAVARHTSLAMTQAAVMPQEELPGLKILKPVAAVAQSKERPSGPAAILDKVQEPSASSSMMVPHEAEPQQMIEALCADLEKEKQDKGTESKGKEKVKKTPKKAKAKAKGKMKRPAAAVVPLRRPAAAAASDRRGVDLDPDPRRAALLSRIPEDIRMQFAHGCSKCRHREFCTTSCCAYRGYT